MEYKTDEISGYNRVMNAVQGILNDRSPYGLLLSMYGSKYVNGNLTDYYTQAELYFKGQKKVIEKFMPDIITTPFVFAYEGEIYGSKLKYFNNAPPQIKEPAIKSYRDIKKLKKPPVAYLSKKYVLDATEMLVSEFKNDKLIAGTTLSNIDSPAMIMGIEGWLDTLLFHPAQAKEMLKISSEYFVEYANALFDKGIDVLIVSNMFSNPSIITPKIMDVLLAFFKASVSAIKQPIIIHHGGAKLEHFLEYFLDLPNIIGFAVDSNDNLKNCRKKIGNKLLLGNIDMSVISNKNPEYIIEKVKKTLINRAKDKNFLLFNSNADIMLDTPEENIFAVYNTIKSIRNTPEGISFG